MKRIISATIVALTLLMTVSCAKYRYETVKGDPMNTRIYTMDNGLKIYMTVNKEEPRLQTYIAVKVGSKNDPHETTGLSHYLEHLMFKCLQSHVHDGDVARCNRLRKKGDAWPQKCRCARRQ